jgi:dihydroflavonol-4-reductase
MILVTGATGLIGSFIVKELVKNGDQVRIIKREKSDLSLISELLPLVEVFEGDILDISSLNQAFQNVDTVIHAAGYISFNNREYKKLHLVNVEGTANLINASLSFPIKHFIHLSSVAAIGKKKGESEIFEDLKWDDNNVSSYAKSKYYGELEVWRGASEGLKVNILNPSVVLGPGSWKNGSTQIFKYIWDRKPFYTNGNVNYVDVRDVSAAVVNLLNNGSNNERFILNGGTTSFKNLFTKIAGAFNKPTPSIRISRNTLFSLAFLERVRTFFLNSDPVVTKDTAASAFSDSIYLNKKAKENLKITFKDLDETILWVCEELVQKYKLHINK